MLFWIVINVFVLIISVKFKLLIKFVIGFKKFENVFVFVVEFFSCLFCLLKIVKKFFFLLKSVIIFFSEIVFFIKLFSLFKFFWCLIKFLLFCFNICWMIIIIKGIIISVIMVRI